MTRTPQSFTVFAGEDVSIPITITDNDGAVVDITGASARFIVKRRPSSATPVLDSAASPATATAAVTTPASGLVTVSLADSDTGSLVGTYWWELKLTDASNNETVAAYGYIDFRVSGT